MDLGTKKFEELIEAIKNGHYVKIDTLILGMSRKKDNPKEFDRLSVNGYLFYKSIKDIPKEIIKDELDKVKKKFSLISEGCSLFKNFAAITGVDYYLVLDVQTAGITICAEIEGQYQTFI